MALAIVQCNHFDSSKIEQEMKRVQGQALLAQLDESNRQLSNKRVAQRKANSLARVKHQWAAAGPRHSAGQELQQGLPVDTVPSRNDVITEPTETLTTTLPAKRGKATEQTKRQPNQAQEQAAHCPAHGLKLIRKKCPVCK